MKNQLRLLAFLASLVLRTACVADAETTIIDADAVPTLTPRFTMPLDHGQFPADLMRRFKFTPDRTDEYEGAFGQDRTDAYRRVYTAPEMGCTPLDLHAIGRPQKPGLRSVGAFYTLFRRDEIGVFRDEMSPPQWRWEPPVELRQTWFSWAHPASTDHFAALLLYPLKWEDRDPSVFYFDANFGLKWRTEIPRAATVLKAGASMPVAPYPYASTSDILDIDRSARTSITRDGSRVLVLLRSPEAKVSSLFIYDGGGSLQDTILLPLFYAVDLQRTRNGNTFLLSGERTVSIHDASGKQRYDNQSECYLLNSHGAFLGRFVDDAGNTLSGSQNVILSEDSRYACGSRGKQAFVYSVASLLGGRVEASAEGEPAGQ